MTYRYLGNKARISDWIASVVREHVPPGSTVADPMCGTATMSEAFARNGFGVIASDELRWVALPVVERDLDFACAFNNVIVCQNVSALI